MKIIEWSFNNKLILVQSYSIQKFHNMIISKKYKFDFTVIIQNM